MAQLSVDVLGHGWYLVSDGARRWRVAVAIDGGRSWAFVDGAVSVAESAAEGGTPTRSRHTGEVSVMAPMPATVVALHAVPGQTVRQGDTLIVLEAMKMELPVRSPRDGVIKAVRCAAGELVQPGVNLLDFE